MMNYRAFVFSIVVLLILSVSIRVTILILHEYPRQVEVSRLEDIMKVVYGAVLLIWGMVVWLV